MDHLRQDDLLPPGLVPYLLPGEVIVVAAHQHWARVAEPVATTTLALVVALFVDASLTSATRSVGTVVWLAFLLVVCRLVWRLLEWRHDWFVATDKRLLLLHGLLTHKVSMMPLVKVTDMSYERSLPARVLGYGRFIMESAGQDQALRVVSWVARPDETYRAICGEMFPVSGGTRGAAHRVDDGGLDEAPDVPQGHGGAHRGADSHSRAMPVHGGESLYESEDLRQRRRGPDTGPIPADPDD
ncbi:MAG TPA: PH domain-containing protein [Intrasporangium sp.]|uniref:PH domain-containing protein n=1 Tax=Intrasporangium sp. TaxID=1925024 RepID=UPI002D794856|nr:PH domain-containing protein [Intrasporangium sp.]HET7397669.1 PH domain-containing protein [Intrasporangium sp.]